MDARLREIETNSALSGAKWIALKHIGRSNPVAFVAMALVLAVIASLAIGPVSLSFEDVLKSLFHLGTDPRAETVVWQLRLPRTLVGMIVGAGLAVSGALMQGLFRNPMVDPGLIGIAPGAAMGAAAVIVFGNRIFPGLEVLYLLPLCAFMGGMIVALMVYRAAVIEGRTSIIMLLLVGIAMTAICSAATGFFVHLSNERQIRDITFWTMGSLGGARWEIVYVLTPCILIPLLITPWLARGLDALNLGEREAAYLGFPIEKLKRWVCLLTAIMVGGCVAVSGVVGFIGLLVPHVIRLIVGPAYRRLIPLTALGGATLLVFADMIARWIVAPAELPVGIITSLIGGPFFLVLLIQMRRSLTL